MRAMLIPFLLLAACDKGDGKANASPPPTGASAVVAKWRDAGLQVTALDPADGDQYGGGSCQSGQVNNVDIVLCTYASDEAASAAESVGLASVGLATGAALVSGKLMLVIADRRKSDPEGRTINQATRLFRGR